MIHRAASTGIYPYTEQQVQEFTRAVQKIDGKLRHIDNFKRKYNWRSLQLYPKTLRYVPCLHGRISCILGSAKKNFNYFSFLLAYIIPL